MHFRHEKQQQQQLNTTNVYIDTSTLTFITFFFVPLTYNFYEDDKFTCITLT